jgi:phage baseplate assembly protein W
MNANAGDVLGRGIAFPPRIQTDGRLAFSEGEDNVRESIQIILLTELRERLRRPTFGAGLGQFLFEPNTVTTRHAIADRITKALTAWERRIVVQSVEVDPDPKDPEAAVATISYKLVATQTSDKINLNIALAA